MTPQRAKELLPVITAFAEGKNIQIKINTIWYDQISDLNINPSSEYRIKPSEPTLRPWKPKEVPVGALLRGMNDVLPKVILGYHNINGRGPYVVYTREDWGNVWLSGDSVEVCFFLRECSLDHGKTWQPCGTLE